MVPDAQAIAWSMERARLYAGALPRDDRRYAHTVMVVTRQDTSLAHVYRWAFVRDDPEEPELVWILTYAEGVVLVPRGVLVSLVEFTSSVIHTLASD